MVLETLIKASEIRNGLSPAQIHKGTLFSNAIFEVVTPSHESCFLSAIFHAVEDLKGSLEPSFWEGLKIIHGLASQSLPFILSN